MGVCVLCRKKDCKRNGHGLEKACCARHVCRISRGVLVTRASHDCLRLVLVFMCWALEREKPGTPGYAESSTRTELTQGKRFVGIMRVCVTGTTRRNRKALEPGIMPKGRGNVRGYLGRKIG